MAINPKQLVDEISGRIEAFTKGLPSLTADSYRSIQTLLQQIKLDATGNIRVSVENLRLINRIKLLLQDNLLSDAYLKNVSDLRSSFDDITKLQTEYFSSVFDDFEAPEVVAEMQKVSVNSTIESLGATSINANIIQGASDILEKNITSGASFADMQEELRTYIVGNPKVDSKLASYSKQILTDSMSMHTANYQKLITDDLGLKWYQYVGPKVTSTRPLCDALVDKRWVHESELGSISRGYVDGKNVGTAGMIAGTNKSNFQVNRGGYNCNHLLVPVAEEAVPKEVRIKLYKREGINYDERGLQINE